MKKKFLGSVWQWRRVFVPEIPIMKIRLKKAITERLVRRKTGALLASHKLSTSDAYLSCLKDCFRHSFSADPEFLCFSLVLINFVFVCAELFSFPRKITSSQHKKPSEMNFVLIFYSFRTASYCWEVVWVALNAPGGISWCSFLNNFGYKKRGKNDPFRHEPRHLKLFAHLISIYFLDSSKYVIFSKWICIQRLNQHTNIFQHKLKVL